MPWAPPPSWVSQVARAVLALDGTAVCCKSLVRALELQRPLALARRPPKLVEEFEKYDLNPELETYHE